MFLRAVVFLLAAVPANAQFAAFPSTLNFPNTVTGQSPNIVYVVLASLTPVPFTLSTTTTNGVNWLSAQAPFGSTTTTQIQVTVNPAGLAPGTYFGTVVASAPGGGTAPLTIPVALVVATPAGALTVSPTALSFTSPPGQSQPLVQILSLATTVAGVFTANASTITGSGWLSVSPNTVGPATLSTVSVIANPIGLASGAYTGTVTITANGSSQTVPVTLLVGAGSLIPSSLTFRYSPSGTLPASQSLVYTSPNPTGVTAIAVTNSGGNWLTASPTVQSAAVQYTVTVGVNPTGLAAGTYTGSVILIPNVGTQLTVPVTLVVSPASGSVSVSPSTVSFNYVIGGTVPAQAVTLSSPTPFNYSATPTTSTGTGWLQVTNAAGGSVTSANLMVIVSPFTLAVGTYHGLVTIVTTSETVVIPVTLGVLGNHPLSASPSSMTFTYPPGQSFAASQMLTLTSNIATSYEATASTTTGSGWLSVTPSSGNISTQVPISVNVNPGTLPAGTYQGTVIVTTPVGGTQTIPVTLTVSATAGAVTVNPSSLTFSYQPGGSIPTSQSLVLTTPSPTTFAATAYPITGGNWLAVGPNRSSTIGLPATAQLFAGIINPASLPTGTFTGTIEITTSLGSATVDVTLIVGPTLTATPSSLAFDYQVGGVIPAARTVSISSGSANVNFNISYATASGGAWLSAPPPSPQTTPATFSVSVDPRGLAVGTYSGSLNMFATGVSSATIPVILIVHGPPCTYSLFPSQSTFTSSAAGGYIDVTTLPGCPWQPASLSSWITITSVSAGRASFTIGANTGATRTGAIRIAGQLVSIQQDAASAAPLTPGLRFVPVAPCRLMETRQQYNFEGRTGPFGPPFMATGEVRTLSLLDSTVCSIPTDARAYLVNVTVVPRTSLNYATVWPAGEARPSVWTIRSPDGQTVANSAIVKAGISNSISIYTSNDTDVLIDVSGYFTDTPSLSNLAFYPLTPCRILDTRSQYRSPPGPFGPPSLLAQTTRTIQVPASPYCSVPPGAKAYAMTLTAVPQGPLQFITAWASGTGQPNVSSINSPAGRVLANSVVLPASATGTVDVYAYNATDLLLDITGYFAPDDGTGLLYFPITQCRLSETFMEDNATRTQPMLGTACAGIASTAQAYALTTTAIPNGSSMPYLTMWPSGQPQPVASILNAFEGQTVTNSAIIAAGTGGAVNDFTYRRTNVVLEISGYFGR